MCETKAEKMNEYEDDAPLTDSIEDEVGEYAEEKPDVIKVSARSRSTAVAGAIAGVMRQHHKAEVQAIGAGAVNQAVKALAIARGYLERDEIDIVSVPYFTEVDIDGQETHSRALPRRAAALNRPATGDYRLD